MARASCVFPCADRVLTWHYPRDDASPLRLEAGAKLAELIAEPTHCNDRRGLVAERLELRPQPPNVDVDCPALPQRVLTPGNAGQLLGPKDRSGWVRRGRRRTIVV